MSADGNYPRVEFFEKTITEANEEVPLLVKVSASGQLVHVMTVDEGGVVKSNERILGMSSADTNNLLGRLLTLADATFTDATQRSAYKDMVRQHVRDWLTMLENSAMASAGIDGWVGRPFSTVVEGPREEFMA